VSEALCSRGSRETISRPQAATARRVASACRAWAGEHVVEPLLAQHEKRLPEPEQQVGRRRVRKKTRGVGLEHLVPAPVGARQAGRARRGERLLAQRVEGQAGRQHQALLRAADGDVDTPFVVAVVDRAERADRVDEKKRGMAGPVDRRPYLGDARGDAGRGLVVDDADGLDGVHPVQGEAGADRLGVGAVPPVAGDQLDLEAEAGGHACPECGEVAGLAHQHAVAGRERVHQRRLPGSGARVRIDDDRAFFRAEDLAQTCEHLMRQLLKVGPAMVDRRPVDGAEDAVRDVGRPRDLQEMASRRHGPGPPSGQVRSGASSADRASVVTCRQ
jgi:hypothetical protein